MLKNYFATLPDTELKSQLRRVFELMGWCSNYQSPGLVKLMKEILVSIVGTIHEGPITMELETWIKSHETDIYSGCLDHRLMSAFSSQSVLYNTISSSMTHLKFNTSSLHACIRERDYTIVYQSVFLGIGSAILQGRQLTGKMSELNMATLDCGGCTQVIMKEPINYNHMPG